MVTVWPTPKGLPMASTTSPTLRQFRLAQHDHGQLVEVDLDHGQVRFRVQCPPPVAGALRPSVPARLRFRRPPSTTWLFVST